jgi:uncharacterized protein
MLSRRKVLGLAAAAVLLPARAFAQPRLESTVTVTNARRRLVGTLSLPDGPAPFPVVLIVPGSGDIDRNGNNPISINADTYRKLAAALAQRGVASVRYDKRYVGASDVPPLAEVTVRFEDEVGDAVAWLRMLARDRRFRDVIIAGHSQGSLTGMLAAERMLPAAFVSLEGLGQSAGQILIDQLAAQYPPQIVDRARQIVAELDDGETAGDVPAVLQTVFRPSVQPYLMSWFPYDPAREIAQLRCPVTIVQGTADTQVPPSEAQLLKAAAPAARLVIVARMTHTLKLVDPGTDPIRTYLDPSLPIAPEVVDAVAGAVR